MERTLLPMRNRPIPGSSGRVRALSLFGAPALHGPCDDVTDFGPMPDGGVYFVMEYLEGTSLEDLIEKKGALPLHRGLNVANPPGPPLA